MLWQLFCGYVIINMEGLGQERFLSLLIKKGIKLLYVKRESYTKSRVALPYLLFGKFKKLALENGIRLSECREFGLPKLLSFFGKRPAIALGIVFFLVLSFALSGLCLSLEIKGCHKISEFELAETVSRLGFSRFCPKHELDPEAIEKGIKEAHGEILYAEAHFKGTKLLIEIIESDDYIKPKAESFLPLVAKKAGVICGYTVLCGKAEVNLGQRVSPGDILVSSEYTLEDGTYMKVTAEGSVFAQVMYRAVCPVSYENKDFIRTGRSAKTRELRLGRKRIALSGENTFENFEREETILADLGENSFLHFSLVETEFFETSPVITEKSALSAVLSAKEAAYYTALGAVPEDAELIDTELFINGGNAIAIIITKEQIGVYANGGNFGDDP